MEFDPAGVAADDAAGLGAAMLVIVFGGSSLGNGMTGSSLRAAVEVLEAGCGSPEFPGAKLAGLIVFPELVASVEIEEADVVSAGSSMGNAGSSIANGLPVSVKSSFLTVRFTAP